MNPFLLAAAILMVLGISVGAAEDDAGSAYLRSDFAQAAAKWSSEAERGNPTAQYDLACMIASGRGRPVDREKASSLFQKAADGGDLDARKWVEISGGAYSLEVQRAGSQVTTNDEPFLTEVRGDSMLIRRIDLRAGAWRDVIDGADKTSAQQVE